MYWILMVLTRPQARKIVEATLSTLWERRPFKHDLGAMMFDGATEADKEEGRGGPLWEEMMGTMEDAVIKEAGLIDP